MEDNSLNITGAVRFQIFKTDVLVEELHLQNLVVATGRQAVSRAIGGTATDDYVATFGAGTNGATPTESNTSLTGAFTKATATPTYPGNSVTFDNVLEETEANGLTLREFGLITQGGDLFARVVRPAVVKDNTMRIRVTWTINL